MVAATTLDSYIRSDPGIRGGRPRLDGTRITVQDVVLWHLNLGMPLHQIAGDYQLSLAAVHAAMAYYYDHRQEIDRQTAADEALKDDFEKQYVPPSAIKRAKTGEQG